MKHYEKQGNVFQRQRPILLRDSSNFQTIGKWVRRFFRLKCWSQLLLLVSSLSGKPLKRQSEDSKWATNMISCQLCSYRCIEENDFKTHFASVHEQNGDQIYSCSICEFKHKSTARFNWHIRQGNLKYWRNRLKWTFKSFKVRKEAALGRPTQWAPVFKSKPSKTFICIF